MPRNMSFALTTQQIIDETKDVTRRFGWDFLVPDDVVMACKKCMGLKKGEKIVKLKPIRIVSTRWELLISITPEDVVREGFPDWTPKQFLKFIADHYRLSRKKMQESKVNRIEFMYPPRLRRI